MHYRPLVIAKVVQILCYERVQMENLMEMMHLDLDHVQQLNMKAVL